MTLLVVHPLVKEKRRNDTVGGVIHPHLILLARLVQDQGGATGDAADPVLIHLDRILGPPIPDRVLIPDRVHDRPDHVHHTARVLHPRIHDHGLGALVSSPGHEVVDHQHIGDQEMEEQVHHIKHMMKMASSLLYAIKIQILSLIHI